MPPLKLNWPGLSYDVSVVLSMLTSEPGGRFLAISKWVTFMTRGINIIFMYLARR